MRNADKCDTAGQSRVLRYREIRHSNVGCRMTLLCGMQARQHGLWRRSSARPCEIKIFEIAADASETGTSGTTANYWPSCRVATAPEWSFGMLFASKPATATLSKEERSHACITSCG